MIINLIKHIFIIFHHFLRATPFLASNYWNNNITKTFSKRIITKTSNKFIIEIHDICHFSLLYTFTFNMLDNNTKFILEKINIIYPYNQSIDYTKTDNMDNIFNNENKYDDDNDDGFKSQMFNYHDNHNHNHYHYDYDNDINNQNLMDFIIECIIKCNF
jgi:hypothetical protein